MSGDTFSEATKSHTKFKELLKELASEHERVWNHAQLLALHREQNGTSQPLGFGEALDLPGEDGREAVMSSPGGRSQGMGCLTEHYSGKAFRTPLALPSQPVLPSTPPLSKRSDGQEKCDAVTHEKVNQRSTSDDPIIAGSTMKASSSEKSHMLVAEKNREVGLDMKSNPSEDSNPRPETSKLNFDADDGPTFSIARGKKSTPTIGGKSDNGSLVAEQSALLYNLDRDVLFRLQARLGVFDGTEQISARHLFNTVKCLGLDRFSEHQIEKLVTRMMRIVGGGDDGSVASEEEEPVRPILMRTFSLISNGISNRTRESTDCKVPFKSLLHFLVAEESSTLIGSDLEGMLHVIKEVLLSGDANRLVAELTSVRVDDLAAPLPSMDLETILEPLIGVAIVLNGAVIGLQTDRNFENWGGWMWIESGFTLFFLFELFARIRIHGLYEYYTGVDKYWSLFDTVIVAAALFDTGMDMRYQDGHETATFTIIRTVRLTRLTRLFRIFRLGFLRELNVMIKGLLGGFRTLFWAFVLLFLAIYMIAVFATYTLGYSERDGGATEELFSSLPRAMLTCFRCFTGDCTTSKGEPIVKIYSDIHGWAFVACYLGSFTCVNLGLFNLIMALYVEITMAAAKRTEDLDKKRQARESLRVAHLTKNLLKKFCLAQNVAFSPMRITTVNDVSKSMRVTRHVDLNEDMSISKELFLLIVQDPEVQRLMNDLDIPPDRASLFDVLDADGTGDLHVTELVHGLLKVRGEARKSDVVASLLAVRAVQEMIRFLEKRVISNQESMMDHLGIVKRQPSKKSIWDSGFRVDKGGGSSSQNI